MKSLKFIMVVGALVITNLSHTQDIRPDEVKEVMIKVADWQMEHFQDTGEKKRIHL